jgi:hypothetical protein
MDRHLADRLQYQGTARFIENIRLLAHVLAARLFHFGIRRQKRLARQILVSIHRTFWSTMQPRAIRRKREEVGQRFRHGESSL